MKEFSRKIYFFILIALFFCAKTTIAQIRWVNNCEAGITLPRWIPPAATPGFGGQTMISGSTGGASVIWAYQNAPLPAPPAGATAHSGTRVLYANTAAGIIGTSRALINTVPFNLNRNCANAQMKFGFWMYRNGTDFNPDRINVWVNTVSNFGGATLLGTVFRSRALTPYVYGLDGWYYYEFVIPTSFTNNTYLLFDVVDGSAGASGNIFVDDLVFYDNGGNTNNISGGIADAGDDVTICTGGSEQIGSSTTPNTTYAWVPATGLNNTTLSNPTANPTITTNYTVTSTTTGAGCTVANTDIVVVNVSASQAPVITSAASTTVCSGTALSFPFSASNAPTGYLWLAADNFTTTGETNMITVVAGTLNDVITSPSNQVVTYSVSAYNAACPAGTNPIQSFSVNVDSVPSLIISGGPVLCNGGTAVLTASAAGIVSYLWSTGATTSTITATAGTYSCVATTVSGCTTSATYNLTQPSALTGASTSNAICSGGTTAMTLNGAGGTAPYTYSWIATSNPGVSGESLTNQTGSLINNTLINTGGGNQVVAYSYTVSDANGCKVFGTTSATVYPLPTLTITGTPIPCNGGTGNLTANGTGITTYSWSNGSTAMSIVVFAGVYGCTVTSASGCQASSSYILTQPTALSSSLSGPTTICSGVTTNNTISGIGGTAPYNFSWIAASNANVNGESLVLQTTSVIANTLDNISGVNQTVTYTYNVTDANSCITSSVQSITVRAPLSSSTSGATFLCSGATANITINGIGGTPAYSFTWIAASNPNITGENTLGGSGSTINDVLVNISATTQSVNYTYNVFDANGCVAVGTKTLTVYSPTITIANPTNTTICQTATAVFTTSATGGSGAFTYQWQEDNGGGFFNISDVGVYSGSSTPSLTITAPAPSMNNNRYRCQINDGCNSTLSGVAILFVTPALYISSGTAEQPILSSVGRCASKQEILRFKVDMTTGSCPSTPTVTNIAFTAAGTQSEVNRAYIYYTGTNPNFSTNNLYATITNVVGGTINASGSQAVAPGTVYFWLAYDIKPTGVGGAVDASWSTITFSGGAYPGTYTVSAGNPAGSRNISACVAPGGISNGLTYWLKSNDGTNLSGNVHDAPIRSWGSSYSDTALLRQPTATKRPLLKEYPHDTLFNFNPYLSFDGNDDILQNGYAVDLLNDDGLAMVICARNSSPNNRPCFGFSSSDGGLQYQINPENELRYQNSTGTQVISFAVSGFSDPDSDFLQAKMLAIHGNSTGTPDFADFMRNDDVVQSSGNNAPYIEQGLSIGGSGDGGSFNRGNNTIAEIITYNKNLSKTELDKVQTYAAIKYGIHLNKDYVSSAGDIIWDYAADPTYNNDIAGIGRDDKSGLNQKQTQSVNKDEMLTIGLDSIENSNKNNTAVFAVDNSFLVWGNNNLPAYSTPATSIPLAAPFLPTGIQARINRVWKLQGTNFGSNGNNFKNIHDTTNKVAASTIISVGFDDYLLQGVSTTSSLRLLVDDDGTDFSNAIVKGPGKSSTGATASGARIIFDTIEVGDGKNYITLATINKVTTPLPTQLIDFYANCENDKIMIHWKTATEVEVKEYVIEYSFDGISFSPYKTITSKGNHSSGSIYKVQFDDLFNQLIYFRLKEITTYNDVYYYKTISTHGNCSESKNLSEAIISPNPVSNLMGEASIKFSNMLNGETKIKLMNNVGSIMYETSYKSEENYNTLKLSFKGLTSGVYFIDANNNNGNFKLKLIVTD